MPKIDETFLYGVFATMANKRKASRTAKLGEAPNNYEQLHPAGWRDSTASTFCR
jgi:hypothetical protein